MRLMNWRRPCPTEGVPNIAVMITPNGVTHHFDPEDTSVAITETPHIELLGHDISRRMGHLERMDEETRALYGAVKALDARISSVSIEPRRLSVRGPERVNRKHCIRGDWPAGLDLEIVHCLAQHMGWEDVNMSVRRQSERELWGEMDAIIADAQRQGIEPPEGWVPHRLRFGR